MSLRFQVFEYNQVVRDVVDIHYPVHEMTCNSKIRCVVHFLVDRKYNYLLPTQLEASSWHYCKYGAAETALIASLEITLTSNSHCQILSKLKRWTDT